MMGMHEFFYDFFRTFPEEFVAGIRSVFTLIVGKVFVFWGRC